MFNPCLSRRLLRCLAIVFALALTPIAVLVSATPANAYDCVRSNSGEWNEYLDCAYVENYYTAGRVTEGITHASMYPNPVITVSITISDLKAKDDKCTWIEIKGGGVRHQVPETKFCDGKSKRKTFWIETYNTTRGQTPRLYHCVDSSASSGKSCWNFFAHRHTAKGRWVRRPLVN